MGVAGAFVSIKTEPIKLHGAFRQVELTANLGTEVLVRLGEARNSIMVLRIRGETKDAL